MSPTRSIHSYPACGQVLSDLVSGNGYVEAVAASEEIRELHALRPDRMQIIPGPDGWLEAYSYTLDGRATRIAGDAIPGVRRVLHIKLFHPTNDHYGMSPIEPAASLVRLGHRSAQHRLQMEQGAA